MNEHKHEPNGYGLIRPQSKRRRKVFALFFLITCALLLLRNPRREPLSIAAALLPTAVCVLADRPARTFRELSLQWSLLGVAFGAVAGYLAVDVHNKLLGSLVGWVLGGLAGFLYSVATLHQDQSSP
jgi:hypothetical protein